MFSLAVISDIHSNLEALEAVLQHMRTNFPEIKEIYCAGDVCGYGPDPVKCIEILLDNKLVTKKVCGNHDNFIARSITPPMTRKSAHASFVWQIGVIPLEFRWEISQLPQFTATRYGDLDTEIALVHGSPQYPLDEYIYPNTDKQRDLFDYMDKISIDILILGHTHKPFVKKKNIVNGDRELLMVNPGSVGQPRDRNPKASYAVIDDVNKNAEIIRVEYDIETVARKIISAGLPEILANRLFQGI